jgi:hypothetical protein
VQLTEKIKKQFRQYSSMKFGKIVLLLLLFSVLSLSAYAQDEQAPPDEQAPVQPESPLQTPPSGPPEGAPSGPPSGPPQGEPPPIQVPEGCSKIETSTGVQQINCGFDFKEPEFKEFDVKNEAEKCDGRFEMVQGKPTCIKEGTTSISDVVCPTQQELDAIKSSCKGKMNLFIDKKGCSAAMCVNEDFEKKFSEKINEKFEGEKGEIISCQKNGGEVIQAGNSYECIKPFDDPLAIQELSGKITQDDIESAAEKLGSIEDKIQPLVEKLEVLSEKLESEGKTGEAEILKQNIEKLNELEGKIEAMKTGLDVSVKMDEEQRRNLIADLHSIQSGMSDVTLGIVKGEVITDASELERKYKMYEEYYGRPFTKEELEAGVEAEKGAQEKIRSCDGYAESISFDPPDPDGKIVQVDLKFLDGKCDFTIHTQMGPTANYKLPKEIYAKFSGPEDFVNLPCTGDACEFVKNLVTGSHGETPEQQCADECITKDCTLGHYACMQQNLTKCEYECGMKSKEEGPYSLTGEFDPMQACVMMCAGDEAQYCQPGGGNPTCITCEGKCIKAYGPGKDYERCLTEEKLNEEKAKCEAQGMYAEPYEELVVEKMCIVGVNCKEFKPAGDNPGTGPDSVEPGHAPGEEFGPPISGAAAPTPESPAPDGEAVATGQAVLNESSNPFASFFEWLGGIFK